MRDPRMAANTLLNVEMDDFQGAILKLFWHVPSVIDHSGVSTGKTERLFIWAMLRALLMPNRPGRPRIITIYYQGFDTAIAVFWAKFQTYLETAPSHTFADQLVKVRGGKIRGDISRDNVKIIGFRNGNQVQLPAGNFLQDAKNQASRRFNDLAVDEFAEIDAFSKGIDKQLTSRATAPSFNKNHPLWTNHTKFLGHAEDPLTHPSYKRVKAFKKLIAEGSVDHAIITSCYRDWKPEFAAIYLEPKPIRMDAVLLDRAENAQKWDGLYVFGGKNWYNAEANKRSRTFYIPHCTRPILRANSPQAESYYVLAWDSAQTRTQTSDYNAGVILRITPIGHSTEPQHGAMWIDGMLYKLRVVWATQLRGQSLEQISGLIHKWHRQIGFSMIMLDPMGGGSFLYQELRKTTQLIDEQHIKVGEGGLCTMEELYLYPNSQPLITYFERKSPDVRRVIPHRFMNDDAGPIHFMHKKLRDAIRNDEIEFPIPRKELTPEQRAQLTPASTRALKNIEITQNQLTHIQVKATKDGDPLRTKYGWFSFFSGKKKDLAYALAYAYIAARSVVAPPFGNAEDDPTAGDE